MEGRTETAREREGRRKRKIGRKEKRKAKGSDNRTRFYFQQKW